MYRYVTKPGLKCKGQHVVITGGSAGLGLAVAKSYAAKGARVSILARSLDKLKIAQKCIQNEIVQDKTSNIFIQSTDVTNFGQVQDAISAAIVFHGQGVDQLICCAGLAQPGYFVDQDVGIFSSQMAVNDMGTLNAIKAVVPNMRANRKAGRIVLVSSACGYIGFVGYSQYCASKYALRGLADALRNEFLLYDITVQIYYPGNMDTPGFENEEKTKPDETRAIEGASDCVR